MTRWNLIVFYIIWTSLKLEKSFFSLFLISGRPSLDDAFILNNCFAECKHTSDQISLFSTHANTWVWLSNPNDLNQTEELFPHDNIAVVHIILKICAFRILPSTSPHQYFRRCGSLFWRSAGYVPITMSMKGSQFGDSQQRLIAQSHLSHNANNKTNFISYK